MGRRASWLVGVAVWVLASGMTVLGAPGAKKGNVNLPYRFPNTDANGNSWMVYNGGRLMQQGNMPFCSDFATLSINGGGMQMAGQGATLLENGEVMLENIRVGQFTVTRRFLQSEDGTLRVIEIVRNSKGEEASANMMLNFNCNYGIQGTRTITDPKAGDKTVAAVLTDSQGRNEVSVFAGKGSKVAPNVNAQPNNNMMQVSFDLKIPAGKQVAIAHFHQFPGGADQADKIVAGIREGKLLSDIDRDTRRLLVNFGYSSGALDDLDLLRGGGNDIVELTNGDQLRGTLAMPVWEMEADFGKVQVPTAQMAGLLTSNGMQKRQLLVTTDGEIIGGRLTASAIDIQVSSGQKIAVPAGQVMRIGRRTPEEGQAVAGRPMLYLRSGDRFAVKAPAGPLQVATRFGVLNLAPATIVQLDLQPDDSPVHSVRLTDGSTFNGLLIAPMLEFTLERGGTLKLPLAAVRKLSFALAPSDDSGAGEVTSSLRLTGDDVLAGGLSGEMALLTSYGQVKVKAAEIKRLVRVKDTLEDLQFTLWDDSVLSGRLAQPYLECAVAGTVARVPVGLLDVYTCSTPQPSASIVERVQKLVAELNADDWKQRERAEQDLLGIGMPIIGTLKQMRASQPPEAQQRIDSILKQLTKTGAPAKPAVPALANPIMLR